MDKEDIASTDRFANLNVDFPISKSLNMNFSSFQTEIAGDFLGKAFVCGAREDTKAVGSRDIAVGKELRRGTSRNVPFIVVKDRANEARRAIAVGRAGSGLQPRISGLEIKEMNEDKC